MILKLRLSG